MQSPLLSDCIAGNAVGRNGDCLNLARETAPSSSRDRVTGFSEPRSNFGNTPARNNTLMRVLSSSVVCNPRRYVSEEAEEAEERDAAEGWSSVCEREREFERYTGTE